MNNQQSELVTRIAKLEAERQSIYANAYNIHRGYADMTEKQRERLEQIREALALLWNARRAEISNCVYMSAPKLPYNIKR